MKAEDVLALMVPATYLAMLIAEAIWPARVFPKIRGWRVLGIVGLVLAMTMGVVAPLLLPVEWLAKHRLIDGTKLGVPLGVVVGYLVVSLVSFLWHRSLHRFGFLWRLHQLHHAPARLDLSSGTVFHPLDLFMFTAVQMTGLTLVIGLDPLAAGIVGYVATFYAFFQHWNVKTPRWLGYVIQRPESHCRHHELGVHGSNYADLPLWDMLARSFSNPETFDGRVGFDKPGSTLKMLALIDVHADDDKSAVSAAAE